MIYVVAMAPVVFISVLAWIIIASLQGDVTRLWQHIEILEGDKRALTESLCRAQGKPYIRSEEKRDLIPSDGWFDGAVKVKVNGEA